MKLSKILWKSLLGLLVAMVLFLGLVVYPYFANIVMPWDRARIVNTCESWGGLADIPVSAWRMDIDTDGGMFTRQFFLKFEMDVPEIAEWIERSKGLDKESVEEKSDGTITYRSHGFEGAIGGTVTVDYKKGLVWVEMSWS